MSKNTLKICPHHNEYKTPMIFTFAFIGSELWCPYCGYREGILGAAEGQPATDELNNRLKIYKTVYGDFLRANSSLICSSLEWPTGSGIFISPSELPKEEIARYMNTRENGWNPNIKAEDMKLSSASSI